MTKKVLIAILAVLLIVVGLTSCNDGSSGGKTDPKRPATLSVNSFTEYYPVGTEKPSGSLLYTDTDGKITPVDINAEGVTTNFNAQTAGDNKTLIISYKGIDAAKTYSVRNVPTVLDAAGCFVVDDLTTYDFTAKSNKVVVEKYASWKGYQNVDPSSTEEKTYEVKISSNGLVYALVGDKRFYPDGKGGFDHYESDYLAEPEFGYYVSDDKESSSTTIGPTDEKARGKYLVLQFTTDYTMKMWFVESKPTSTAPSCPADYTISASDIKFGTMGVFIKDYDTPEPGATKNLRMYSKNDFKESITIVSPSGDDYRGYSYRLTHFNFYT